MDARTATTQGADYRNPLVVPPVKDFGSPDVLDLVVWQKLEKLAELYESLYPGLASALRSARSADAPIVRRDRVLTLMVPDGYAQVLAPYPVHELLQEVAKEIKT